MQSDVLVIVPPFGPVEYPMLGPSLLRAAVERAGHTCGVEYANVAFAQQVGFDSYLQTWYAEPPLVLGDRTFAPALDPESTPPLEDYWRDVVLPFVSGVVTRIQLRQLAEELLNTQRRAETAAVAFADALADSPRVRAARIVGFSSTFGQHAAALAVARRVKALHPEKWIVLGGGNCEGAMGRQTLASYPFVDFVVDGPAEASFPALVDALLGDREPDVPGVRRRGADFVPAQPVPLDDLPLPNYDDFFRAYERMPEQRWRIQQIPVEGSRGCWWGEKHHCTFCGINGEQMAFRRKSADRLIEEIDHLVAKYGVRNVWATDNILDPRFFGDLIPRLAERRPYEEMFFEVKANLSRAQLEMLVRAGITRLQPGIESLDTSVLRLMQKGTTALRNLQLLKWAEELGITLQWNILCGFPEEEPAAYQRMLALARRIPHLPPPKACGPITIDRFSPLFRQSARFGIRIQPARAYAYVYALPEPGLRELAYFHAHWNDAVDTRTSLAPPEYARPLVHQTRIWNQQYGRVRFEARRLAGGAIELHDTRPEARASRRLLEGCEARIFAALDRACSPRSVAAAAGVPVEEATRRLDALVRAGDVAEDRGLYLGLATRAAEESAPHASA